MPGMSWTNVTQQAVYGLAGVTGAVAQLPEGALEIAKSPPMWCGTNTAVQTDNLTSNIQAFPIWTAVDDDTLQVRTSLGAVFQ